MSHIGKMPKDYNYKSFEEEVFAYWEKNGIEEKVRASGGKKFYFLDGPPYVTNAIHVGTAWNKILKDVYIRYQRMNGFLVRDQPGFDMHGLPIEVMVEKKIGIKSKKEIETMGIENFINSCKGFAIENLNIATKQFRNLGVWMDWNFPYRTLDDYYIESVWHMIKRAEDRKLLGKGKKVVHWCPRCETVLAGYESTDEYREVEEDSIYVKFRVEGRKIEVKKDKELEKEKEKERENENNNEYVLIWTTTPWTLPANVAVMAHPDYTYVRVRAQGEVYILAEARVDAVFKDLGIEYEVLESFPGSDLRGLKYMPPLQSQVPEQAKLSPAHMVVMSDQYVTLDEGTGCVHCAPGHGEEDHAVGELYGLPDFSPVDERGVFAAEGGKYAGMNVREANVVIIQDLKDMGLLFKVERTKHRYPHCWRCKTPLILRTASQWFIKVTDLKELILEENEKVDWIPDWAGKARFGNWIRNAKDWVISRQRYWGIPLPIWVCGNCRKYTVIGSVDELRKRSGNDLGKFELHRPWVDRVSIECSCGGTMQRVSDVADVWMDSGSASFADLHYPQDRKAMEKWWPVDMILEGQDQTRGWFYTLMVCGVVLFDKAPYRRVLMHGFTNAEDGKAMHKSLGNVVFPEEVIDKYGRDTLRWYELSCTTWEDLKFAWKAVEETSRFMNMLWSTYYFASLYMNLDMFSPDKYPLVKVERSMRAEDRWILSRFERLVGSVTQAMDGCRVFEAVRELEEFMREDLSRWYVRLIRKRTWSETENPDKMAAYATLNHVLFNYLKIASPIAPFATEKIYRDMFVGLPGMPESAHMLEWPKADGKWISDKLEADMEIVKDLIEACYSARQSARIKTRQPLLRMKVVADGENVKQAVSRLSGVVLEQTNVKEVEVITPQEGEKLRDIILLPNKSLLGPIFRQKSGKIAELIAKLDGRTVMESLKQGGEVFVESPETGKVVLKKEYLSIQMRLPENYKSEKSKFGEVCIDTTKSSELMAEGLMRDVIRRVQEMRKRADLKVDAYIRVEVVTPSEEVRAVLEGKTKEIAIEVRAKELTIAASGSTGFKVREEWDIEGEKYLIGIEEL